MAQLNVSPGWRNQTGGQTSFVIDDGITLEQVLIDFAHRFPDNAYRILGPDGPYRYLSVFVAEDGQTESERIGKDRWSTVRTTSMTVVDVLPPLAGG